MDLKFDTIYQNWSEIFKNNVIDLNKVSFFDPWSLGMVCLKAIENKDNCEKSLILPSDARIIHYLKRMHLDEFMQGLTYSFFLGQFNNIDFTEHNNLNVQEILHCEYR